MTENKNTIKIFENPQFGEVRVYLNERDEPLFCLADICKALDLTNPRSVKSRLASEDVQLVDLHAVNPSYTPIGNSMANFVTESGFYVVILQSSSPKVKPFRKWVTSEVLPSIRKYGLYATPTTVEAMLADPDSAIKILLAYKEERQKRLEAETVIEANKPKVVLAEAISENGDDCYIGELAKCLLKTE